MACGPTSHLNCEDQELQIVSLAQSQIYSQELTLRVAICACLRFLTRGLAHIPGRGPLIHLGEARGGSIARQLWCPYWAARRARHAPELSTAPSIRLEIGGWKIGYDVENQFALFATLGIEKDGHFSGR
jgi:hypothetical protein